MEVVISFFVMWMQVFLHVCRVAVLGSAKTVSPAVTLTQQATQSTMSAAVKGILTTPDVYYSWPTLVWVGVVGGMGLFHTFAQERSKMETHTNKAHDQEPPPQEKNMDREWEPLIISHWPLFQPLAPC